MKQKKPPSHLEDEQEVFIALASQPSEPVEQPPSPEELNDFFSNSRRFSKQQQERVLAYLDSNPEAYARWIKQGKTNKQPNRASFMFSIAPYAIAACAVVLLLSLGLLWRGEPFKLEQAIDRSYQATVFQENPENFQRTTASLFNTLEQAKQPLSFSSSGQPSSLAQAFMLGLQHNWHTAPQVPYISELPSTVQQPEDYQLGRWYALLWSVSQQTKSLPVDFWQRQLSILDHLQTHYLGLAPEATTAQSKALALQLERMAPVLTQLAKDDSATKSYQKLEQVLLALRYSLIPSR